MNAITYPGRIKNPFSYTVRLLVNEKLRLLALARNMPQVADVSYRMCAEIDRAIDVILAQEDKPNE